MTVRIEVITDLARFQEIALPWQGLWQRSGGYIFQTHDWLSGWIASSGDRKDVRLLVAVAWDADRLVGAMPCAVHRRTGLRLLQWAAQRFSDYCDCLVDQSYRPAEIVAKLWDGVRRSGGFDLISLQQVRPDAQCRAFLDALVHEGGQLQAGERQERCMRIDNRWPSGEAFFRSLNKKGRNNHTRGKRILSELGGDVAFRVIEPGEDIGPVITTMMQLKEAWLRLADPASPLLGSDGPVLRAVLESAWRSESARIFLLTSGEHIAAASFNFVYGGRMEAYFTSYDSTYERASPGTILIVEYAQWSFDRGLRHVDFLRGEEAFKFRLANAETVISSYSGARTLFGHVAVSGHRWLTRRRQKSDAVSEISDEALEAAD